MSIKNIKLRKNLYYYEDKPHYWYEIKLQRWVILKQLWVDLIGHGFICYYFRDIAYDIYGLITGWTCADNLEFLEAYNKNLDILEAYTKLIKNNK